MRSGSRYSARIRTGRGFITIEKLLVFVGELRIGRRRMQTVKLTDAARKSFAPMFLFEQPFRNADVSLPWHSSFAVMNHLAPPGDRTGRPSKEIERPVSFRTYTRFSVAVNRNRYHGAVRGENFLCANRDWLGRNRRGISGRSRVTQSSPLLMPDAFEVVGRLTARISRCCPYQGSTNTFLADGIV